MRRHCRRIKLFGLLSLCALLSVVSNSAAVAASVQLAASDDPLVLGSEGTVAPLDPHRASGTVNLRVVDAVFDPLVREDLSETTGSAPAIVPALAESWTISPDGTTYTFTIRKDVKFHDGTSLDAGVVQANFDRLMNESSAYFDERASGNMSFLTRWIAEASAPAGDTFVLELNQPFSGILRLLSDRRMSIVSQKAMEQYQGDTLGFHPVGTGPFSLETFEQGQPLDLRRNDSYWGGKPNLERIIVQPITDPTAMAVAIQTGEVHLLLSASAQQVEQLRDLGDFTVQYPEPANQYFVRLNARAAPTDNQRFRQALNYAINRDQIATLFDGQAVPLYGPVPRGNELAAAGRNDVYSYDPAKAKAMIEELGIATPVTMKLLVPNSGPGFGLSSQVTALIQQDLKAVGVNVEPQYLEFATLIKTERGGYADDVSGSYNGWTTGADSAYWLERMFSGTQQPPNGVNRGWYGNPEVDKLFEKARAEVDQQQSLKLYKEASDLIAADAPWIFLYQDRLPRIFSKRVSGIQPAGSVYIDYVELDLN